MRTVEITYRYGGPEVQLRPRPADAAAAWQRLDDGNRAFATLLGNLATEDGTARRVVDIDPHDLGLLPEAPGAPSQKPFAAVLGCSDARVPIELIFNEGPNELFVVRVAGNSLGTDVLGSLRYAIEHLRGSLRLVVVLGHSGCGALSAAVDCFLEPGGYLPLATDFSLRSLLDRQLIAVQASARKLASTYGSEVARHPRYREALVETAIVTNAALAAHTLQQELGNARAEGVRAVYGIYLLDSRTVWAPAGGGGDGDGDSDGLPTGLAEPPRDLDGFIALGEAVVRSERIAALLA